MVIYDPKTSFILSSQDMFDKLKEKIYCIESTKLRSVDGKRNGLQTHKLDQYLELFEQEGEFAVRGELEQNPQYKQIIPQIVFQYRDEKQGQNLYFLHRQKPKANEVRLANMCPLFVGGHVEVFDNHGTDLITNAIDREVNEEVRVHSKVLSKKFIGLIYIEDENPVNHVHVGLAYIYTLDGNDISVKETDKMEDIGFVSKNYLLEHKNELTYRSQITLDILS